MDMVERVARAICAEDLFETGYPQYMVDEWVNRGDWKRWVPVARAAIAAMREPTEEMVWAGINANSLTIDGRPLWKCTDDIQARERFSAMIDAALTSSEPQAPSSE